MSVRLNTSKTFKTKVRFNLTTETGKDEEQSFQAEFKRLSREDVEALVQSGKKDAEMLADVLVGWDMTNADDKTAVPFNDDTFKAFLTIPGVAGVSMMRFIETVGASKTKN